nr:hypothetical protein [Candidatus Sigynarchaeota archaeon]
MSAPTAFKMGPLTNCVIPSKRIVLLMLVIMWLSIIPALILEYFYLGAAFNWNPLGVGSFQWLLDLLVTIDPWGRIGIWLVFPFNLLVVHYLNALSSIKVARFFLFIDTHLHKPREGIFPRDFKDPDYYHWHVRRAIKKFPCWILQLTPFTFMKRSYVYNKLGTGTVAIGKNVGLIDSWVDTEFVEIADNVAIGRAAAITSHYFTPGHLIIKKVTIMKDCLVGERVRVPPGAVLGEKSTILAKSIVKLDEHVPAGAIFSGNPAQQVAWASTPKEHEKSG